MAFLGQLTDQISSQFNLAENEASAVGAVFSGQNSQGFSLGDVAGQIDHSAQRKYVEEGYLRVDPYQTDPKQFEVLWQEPEATILIKKRMFSSIAENFRPDFMDVDETLYYKAMRILFQNKCNQISALEKLSKIQKITSAAGSIDKQLIPLILTLGDTFASLNGSGFNSVNSLFGSLDGSTTNPTSNQDGSKFVQVVDRLRTLFAYNTTNTTTTWITNPTNLFQTTFGQGTGVIEITNFTNLTTNVSCSMKNAGSFNFSISDPYEAMRITSFDIEKAISDASNPIINNNVYQLTLNTIEQTIADQQNQLNTIRAGRGASNLTFNIDPNAVFGKQVSVIIDGLGIELNFTYDSTGGTGFPGLGGAGNSVNVSNDYLINGAVAGLSGLNTSTVPLGANFDIQALVASSELSIFQSLIAAIYNKIQLQSNANTSNYNFNKFTNYTRRKLINNFLGQLIIQNMDTVHIYISSKSRFDNKVLGGLSNMFSGMGILQNINTTLTDFSNTFDMLFRPSGNLSIQAEKTMYVGADFPNYLWALLRSQFVTEKQGTHVFGGIVENAEDNWNNGVFTVNIQGKDNSYYFEMGKVNFKPGMENFNGAIFDPLTPFKSNFDTVNSNVLGSQELLEENKYILGELNTSSLAKYKLGPMVGEKATQGNYLQDRGISPFAGNLVRKTFYAPDGLVYKWKEGIGIFTQFGSTNRLNDPNLVGNFNTFQEPFAGLDVMNTISLLIAGVPYNFATFYKATGNLTGFSGDPQSKQDSAHNFINSLTADLSKRNTLWGNFIPYKNLTMNENTIAQSMKAQLSIQNSNSQLDQMLQQLSDLNKNAQLYGAINALSQNTSANNDVAKNSLQNVQAQIQNLTNQINAQIANISINTQQIAAQSNINPSYNSNYLTDGKNDPSDSAARKLLRRQTNYLTRRMSYDVRANQDKNLFIVDDYYDVDYDIAAFNQALSDGVKLYNNDYTLVRDKILTVADLLNLEVFCDTQGHIRVRPPQYNRMPSSIFYRMMYLKDTQGIQIFPDYLQQLFGSQIQTLQQNIEVLEDEIRLQCAVLGHKNSLNSDTDSLQFINNISQTTSGIAGTFSFISTPDDNISDISKLIGLANHDQTDSDIEQNIPNYDAIKNAGTSTKTIFGQSGRYTALFQILQAQNQNASGTNVSQVPNTNILSSTIVQSLITRINTKSGQTLTSSDYLTPASTPNTAVQIDSSQTIDFFKVTQNITDYIQQWQNAIKLLYHTIKNAAEYKSLDNSSLGNSLITPGIYGNSHVPEIFEHMLEDETYDDYGLGSGSRYIIKRSQIQSLSIAANPPPFNAVEVRGVQNPFAPESLPDGLNSFPGGGNGVVSAMAIDYDMWRNYGLKEAQPLQVPFLSDPDSQCGPYAALILSRNRADVLRGSVTISGNEYMQPGEVVYLEDREMLFYVNSVQHSFNEGRNFTTRLDLSYGHAPGQYIPTYMDVIGKLLYKNRETGATIIQRQDSSGNDKNFGVVQVSASNPTAPSINTGSGSDNINSISDSNFKVINNILYQTLFIINQNQTAGNNIQASIELRVYNDNNTQPNSNIISVANQVQQILLGQVNGVKSPGSTNQPTPNAALPAGSVNIVKINIDDTSDRRSPSQAAFSAARAQINNASSVMTTNASNAQSDKLRQALFNYIVDCWVQFTPVSTNVATNAVNTPGF